MFVHLLIGTLQVLALFGQHYAGDPCGDEGYTWHETVNDGRCCEEKHCPAGFESFICTDVTSSKCRRCKPGYFNPDASNTSWGAVCKPWRLCSKRALLSVHTEGTELKDRTCKCDVTAGAYNRNQLINPLFCYHKTCGAGTELTETGECSSCKYGFYKPDETSHSCIAKTVCRKEDGLEIDTEKTIEFSAIEDVYCKNITIPDGTSTLLPKSSVFSSTEKPLTTVVPIVARRQQADGGPKYALAFGVPILIIILVGGIVIFWCIRRRRGKQHQDVEINDLPRPEVEREKIRVDKEGIEHDETLPLKAAESQTGAGVNTRTSRQPTESDEHSGSSSADSSQTSDVLKYIRQQTVDSGYDGNCSSENVSFHLSESSDTATEDLRATPPSPEVHSNPTVTRQCDKCGKLEKDPVQNYIVINGANSCIQLGNQNHMMSSEVGSLHPECSLCQQNSEERADQSWVEIERTCDDDDNSEVAGVQTKLLRTDLPSTNSEQTLSDEGIESFYRKTPVCNSIA